jgi:hypothetical protein
MTSPPLPWLAVTGATQILQQGLDTSQSIAQSWDQQWLTIFDSTLYVAINQTAAIFAAGALIFFIVQFGRQLIVEGDLTRPLQNLIWPIIVVCLLANNAHLLAVSTVSLRSVIHSLSNQVLEVTLLDVKLRDAVQSATSRSAIASEISAQLSQCEGMVGQKQIDCLTAANAQVQATINDYQGFIPLPDSLRNIARAIDGAVQTAQSENNPISGAVFGTAGFFAGFLGSVNQEIIQYVLLAFQWAFTNILEISMLLTGLMGPFAVAGSLLPFEAKPLFAWLTGFFSLGMAQVSYNIIVGLAGVVVVNADVTDTLGFLVIIGLLAPALALAIAAGGGLAVFNIITSGSARMVTMLGSYAVSPRYFHSFR